MDYSFWLAARVLLYAQSHRQDSTYHGLCYTSRGTLAGMRNGSHQIQKLPEKSKMITILFPMTNSVIQWNCCEPNFDDLSLLVKHNPLAVCLQEMFLRALILLWKDLTSITNSRKLKVRLYGVGHMVKDHSGGREFSFLSIRIFPTV